MTDWMTRAACKGMDPNLFHPSLNAAGKYRATSIISCSAYAVSVCKRCPVIDECFAFAIERDELLGVWGGTNEDERQAIRRRRRSRGTSWNTSVSA